MKSTQELEHQIRQSKEPSLLMEDTFSAPDLATYLRELLTGHNLSVQDVVVGCRLDRSYGYQLFNGTRKPTRNFLLRLALLYGLTHGLTADAMQELLIGLGEEGLE